MTQAYSLSAEDKTRYAKEKEEDKLVHELFQNSGIYVSTRYGNSSSPRYYLPYYALMISGYHDNLTMELIRNDDGTFELKSCYFYDNQRLDQTCPNITLDQVKESIAQHIEKIKLIMALA